MIRTLYLITLCLIASSSIGYAQRHPVYIYPVSAPDFFDDERWPGVDEPIGPIRFENYGGALLATLESECATSHPYAVVMYVNIYDGNYLLYDSFRDTDYDSLDTYRHMNCFSAYKGGARNSAHLDIVPGRRSHRTKDIKEALQKGTLRIVYRLDYPDPRIEIVDDEWDQKTDYLCDPLEPNCPYAPTSVPALPLSFSLLGTLMMYRIVRHEKRAGP